MGQPMNLVVGIIAYQSDLDLLMKNLTMFSRQSILEKIANFDLRIVIQDNNRGQQLEKLQKRARKELPNAFFKKLVFMSSENIGFGAGHNRIFQYAEQHFKFHHYLCVNDDGIPSRTMLENLMTFAQQNKNQGIYEARQFPVEHSKFYDPVTGACEWASGCCLLIPAPVYRHLNGFDELFFMYMEDVDFSWRAKMLGYQCYTVQAAQFCHSVQNNRKKPKQLGNAMLESGLKLAEKYNHPNFKAFVLNGLRQCMPSEELSTLQKSLKRHFAQQKSYLPEDFMTFNNNFCFSAVRW